MSKRKKMFELIDEHIETDHVRELIKEYISNLHEKNNELTNSLTHKKKLRKTRTPKIKRRDHGEQRKLRTSIK